jgi:hypothetical protein
VSRASIVATSSALSAKSKTSKFSAIRCGLTDLGIAQKPCSMCQRRTTCAGVLPYLAARSVMSGSVSGPRDSSAAGTYTRTPPSGDQAWVAIPSSACTSRSADCVKYGCSSTWLTAGTTSVRSISRRRCSVLKFETPMARARPSARNVSAAL